MANITATCTKCNNKFFIIDMEQAFLKEKGLPHPTQCPSCRQLRRLNLRGGRMLFKAKCQQCGKETIVSYDPSKVTQQILCKKDFDEYMATHDPIITDPLPEN